MANDNNIQPMADDSQIVLYQPDESISLQVKIEEDQAKEEDNKIVTTEEEMEGFFIVKSILRTKFESSRIFHRDFQNFFSVLLDDTIRQTICRLWFNGEKKFIGIFDENKKETKFELSKLDDIYNYSDQLAKTTERLLKGEKPKNVDSSFLNEGN